MSKVTGDFAAKAAVPATGQQPVFDAQTRGFGLRITATGTRARIAEIHRDGMSKPRIIGPVSAMTCAEARRAGRTKFQPDIVRDMRPWAEVQGCARVQVCRRHHRQPGWHPLQGT
jgi:hypothetical protein